MRRARPHQHIRRLHSGRRILINKGIRKRFKRRRMMHAKTIEYLTKKKGKVYLVGGSVRDKALGIKPKDYDYLVRKIPESRLLELLNKRGKAIKNDMGVIEFTDALLDEKKPTEIVLPRKEESTGHGHTEFKIEYDPDMKLKDDLIRRDYTVNAMAKEARPFGKVIDPQGGLKDIKKRQIKSNNADARIKEDALRMLRGGQFLSRLEGFEMEKDTKEAIKKNKALINATYYDEKQKKEKRVVPYERIAEELEKGLGKGKQPEKMLDLLVETGLMGELVPDYKKTYGFEQNKYHKYPLDKHTREVLKEISDLTKDEPQKKRFRLGMAAILHDIGKPNKLIITEKGRQFLEHPEESYEITKKTLPKLGIMSKDDVRDILFYVRNHDVLQGDISDKRIRQMIDQHGYEKVKDLVAFKKADNIAQGRDTQEANRLYTDLMNKVNKNKEITYSINNLAISAKDLMNKYHIPQGKEIGEIKQNMHKAVLTNPSLNNEKDLKQFIPRRYIR